MFSCVQGQWVILHNSYHATHVLNAVQRFLIDCSSVDGPLCERLDLPLDGQQFRLWIVSKAMPQMFPKCLLQNSIKVFVTHPKVNFYSVYYYVLPATE